MTKIKKVKMKKAFDHLTSDQIDLPWFITAKHNVKEDREEQKPTSIPKPKIITSRTTMIITLLQTKIHKQQHCYTT